MRSIRYYLSRTVPPQNRIALARRVCMKRCGSRTLAYPSDLQHVRSILVIPPEDTLTALYQVENVLSVSEHFPQASLTFFCTSAVAEYYHSLIADASFVEYAVQERYLYSGAFARYSSSIARQQVDICLLLEEHPDIALLDLAGRCGARVRAGYETAGDYPFLNHLVRLDDSSEYLPRRLLAMARSFGAPVTRRAALTVGAEAKEGVTRLLRDLRIDETAPLVTIDAVTFGVRFSPEWTLQLIAKLKALPGGCTCCVPAGHGTEQSDWQWLSSSGVVVVPPLTVPRTAALLARSQALVLTSSPLMQLAVLLKRPGTAIVEQTLRAKCLLPDSPLTAASYTATPGSDTLECAAAATAVVLKRRETTRASVVT